MRNRPFKLSVVAISCALFVLFGLDGSIAGAFLNGPPATRTGAPVQLNIK
ncbi:MAG: hypothetical protein JMDDDDMK_00163 [Acidobacteria bacterium]|nr:hypothetical protein [Acidobacteriota bacterium]